VVVDNQSKPPVLEKTGSRYLYDELQAADITRRFVAPFNAPPHLHHGWNRHWSVGHWKTAPHKHRRLERGRTQNTNAAIAEIVYTTVKFLRQRTIGLNRQQAPCMNFQHLRETLMLTPFLI